MESASSFPQTSRSLVLSDFGQPLSLTSKPVAPPSNGSAIVRILTTVIRPHHRMGFQGKSPLKFPVPYTPGHTAIARVVATGPDSVNLAPGQLVYVDGFTEARDDPHGVQSIIGLMEGGSQKGGKLFKAWEGFWRDIGTVPLEQCHVLNEAALTKMGYSFGDMQILERLTLAYGACESAKLKAGQTVIVAPATGAYSGAVAEVAAQLGCHVVALTRSSSKLEPLTSRHPRITAVEVTGSEGDLSAAILAACPPSGADAYIDISPPLPGAAVTHFQPSLSAVRPHGHVVLLGMIFDIKLNGVALLLKNITIRGQWMYTRQQVADVIGMVEAGVVKMGGQAGHDVVGKYQLEEWEKAVEAAEGVTGWGKQILFTPRI